MTRPFLEIIALQENYVVVKLIHSQFDNARKLAINGIDVPLAIGDKFYHIEHGYFDLYDKDDQFKAFGIRCKERFIKE